MANRKPIGKSNPRNKLVRPDGKPWPEPRVPTPQVIGVETVDGRTLTFKLGALAACQSATEDEDKDTCDICIGGSWVTIKANADAIVQLLTGNYRTAPPKDDGKKKSKSK